MHISESDHSFVFDLPPPDAPLSVLRNAIAERTGVLPEHQKLILGGAILAKGMLADTLHRVSAKIGTDLPLKTYGLVRPSMSDEAQAALEKEREASGPVSTSWRNLLDKWGLSNTPLAGKKYKPLKLTMIGSPETSAVVSDRLPSTSSAGTSSGNRPSTPSQQASSDEPRTINQINELVSSTLARLQSSLNNLFLASKSSQALKSDAIKQQQLYVSEILLQTLLKLDSFDIDSNWTEARKVRKTAIKQIQDTLDRVDAVKEKAKAQHEAALRQEEETEGGAS